MDLQGMKSLASSVLRGMMVEKCPETGIRRIDTKFLNTESFDFYCEILDLDPQVARSKINKMISHDKKLREETRQKQAQEKKKILEYIYSTSKHDKVIVDRYLRRKYSVPDVEDIKYSSIKKLHNNIQSKNFDQEIGGL